MVLSRLNSFNPSATPADLMTQQTNNASTFSKAAYSALAQDMLGQARYDVLNNVAGAQPQYDLASSVARAIQNQGVSDFRDIHGLGDAGSYIANTLGGTAPFLLPSMVGASALSPFASGAVAKTLLGMAGAYAPSYTQLRNENLVTQMNDPSMAKQTPEQQLSMANRVALPGAALDAVVPGMLEGRGGKFFNSLLGVSGVEGATEAGQEYLAQKAAHDYDQRAIDTGAVLNAGIAGGIAGGGMHTLFSPVDTLEQPPVDWNTAYAQQMQSIKDIGTKMVERTKAVVPDPYSTPVVGAIASRVKQNVSLPDSLASNVVEGAYKAKNALKGSVQNLDQSIRYAGSPSEFAQIAMGGMRPGYRSQRIIRDDISVPKAIRDDPQQYAEYLRVHDAELLKGHKQDLIDLAADNRVSDEVRQRAVDYLGKNPKTLAEARAGADFVWKATAAERSQRIFDTVNKANKRLVEQAQMNGVKFNLEEAFAGASSDSPPRVREQYLKMENALDEVLVQHLGPDVVAELAHKRQLEATRRGILSFMYNSMAAGKLPINRNDAATISLIKDLTYNDVNNDPHAFAKALDDVVKGSGRRNIIRELLTRHTNAELDKQEGDNTYEGAFFLTMHPDGMASQSVEGDRGLARLIDAYPHVDEKQQKVIHNVLTKEYGSSARADIVLQHYQRATNLLDDTLPANLTGDAVPETPDNETDAGYQEGDYEAPAVNSDEREYKSGVEALTGQKMKYTGKLTNNNVTTARDYYTPDEQADLDAGLAALRTADTTQRTGDNTYDDGNRSLIQPITRSEYYLRKHDGNEELAAADMGADLKERFATLTEHINKNEREDVDAINKKINSIERIAEDKRTDAQKTALTKAKAELSRQQKLRTQDPDAKLAQDKRTNTLASLRQQATDISKVLARAQQENRTVTFKEASRILDKYALIETNDTAGYTDDQTLKSLRLNKPYHVAGDIKGNDARDDLHAHSRVTVTHRAANGSEYTVDYDSIKLVNSIDDTNFTTTEHANMMQRNEAKLKQALSNLYERPDVVNISFPTNKIYLSGGKQPRFWKHGVKFIAELKDSATGKLKKVDVYQTLGEHQAKKTTRREYEAELRQQLEDAAAKGNAKAVKEARDKLDASVLRTKRSAAAYGAGDEKAVSKAYEAGNRPTNRAAIASVRAEGNSLKYVQTLQRRIIDTRRDSELLPQDEGIKQKLRELEDKLANTAWGKRLAATRASLRGETKTVGHVLGSFTNLKNIDTLAEALDTVDPPIVSKYVIHDENYGELTVDEVAQEERDPDAHSGVEMDEQQQAMKRAYTIDRLIDMWLDRLTLLQDIQQNPRLYDATPSTVAALDNDMSDIMENVNAQIALLGKAKTAAFDNNKRTYDVDTGLSPQQAFSGSTPSRGLMDVPKNEHELPKPFLPVKKADTYTRTVSSPNTTHGMLFLSNFLDNRNTTYESILRYAGLPVTDENVAALSKQVVSYLANVRDRNIAKERLSPTSARLLPFANDKTIAMFKRDKVDPVNVPEPALTEDVITHLPLGTVVVQDMLEYNRDGVIRTLGMEHPFLIDFSASASNPTTTKAREVFKRILFVEDYTLHDAKLAAKSFTDDAYKRRGDDTVVVYGVDPDLKLSRQELEKRALSTLQGVLDATNGKVNKLAIVGDKTTTHPVLVAAQALGMQTTVYRSKELAAETDRTYFTTNPVTETRAVRTTKGRLKSVVHPDITPEALSAQLIQRAPLIVDVSPKSKLKSTLPAEKTINIRKIEAANLDAAASAIATRMLKDHLTTMYITGSDTAGWNKAGYTQQQAEQYMRELLRTVDDKIGHRLKSVVVMGNSGTQLAALHAARSALLTAHLNLVTDQTVTRADGTQMPVTDAFYHEYDGSWRNTNERIKPTASDFEEPRIPGRYKTKDVAQPSLDAAKPDLPAEVLTNVDPRIRAIEVEKWRMSNVLIAYGAKKSLAHAYQSGLPADRVNVGVYKREDVVMVAANGSNVEASNGVWEHNLNKIKEELDRAIAASATIITDKEADRQRSYNTGERAIAEYLAVKGYKEVEDGVWQHQSFGAVIDGFNSKKYSFLHPMSPGSVVLDGETYPTVAHAYEAAKTLSRSVRAKIAAATTKNLHKTSSSLINTQDGTLDPHWKTRRGHVIETLARRRFSDPVRRQRLLDGTGVARIVFKNTQGDKFLGVGVDDTGENVWGEVLMKIRAEARVQTQQDHMTITDLRARKPATLLGTGSLSPTDQARVARKWNRATSYIGFGNQHSLPTRRAEALGVLFANVERRYLPEDIVMIDAAPVVEDAEGNVEAQQHVSRTLLKAMQVFAAQASLTLPDVRTNTVDNIPDIKSTLESVATHLGYTRDNDGVWSPTDRSAMSHANMNALGEYEGLVSTYAEVTNTLLAAIDTGDIKRTNDKRVTQTEKELLAGYNLLTASGKHDMAASVRKMLSTVELAKRTISAAKVQKPSESVVADMAATASKSSKKTPTGKPTTKKGDPALVPAAMEAAAAKGTVIKADIEDIRAAEQALTKAVKDANRQAAEKRAAELADEITANEEAIQATTLQGSRLIKKATTDDAKARIALDTQQEIDRLARALTAKKREKQQVDLTVKHNKEAPTTPEPIKAASDIYNHEFDEVTGEQVRAAAEAITRMRGNDIALTFSTELGARSFSRVNEMGERLINVAINGLSPLSQAHHEAMHDFVRELGANPELKKVHNSLLLAASSPRIMYRLRQLLKDSPEALNQIETDAEERLAYAFQFHAEGRLNLAKDTGVVSKIIDFIRRILGMIPLEERMVLVMDALQRGEFAHPSEVHAALKRLAVTADSENQLAAFTKPLRWLANRLFMTSIDQLHALEIPALSEIADLFAYTPEREILNPSKRGFLQKRSALHGALMARVNHILENTTAEQRKAALESLQSMRKPVTETEVEVRALLDDIYDIMSAAGVEQADHTLVNGRVVSTFSPIRRQANYFPRVWKLNPDQHDDFVKQIMTDGNLSADAAEQVYQAITSGDGLVELAENEHHIGYTPAMYAAKERGLRFINELNAEHYLEYQNHDLVHILVTYVTQASHRAAYSESFGSQGERLRELLDRAKEQGATQDDLDRAVTVVQGLEGTLGSQMNPWARSATNFLITAQNLILLPLALLPSLLDPLGIAVRTGNLDDAWKAFKAGIRGILAELNIVEDKDAKLMELGKILGIVESQNVLDAMGYTHTSLFMGDTARRVNDRFFRWIGMSTWNNRMRMASMAAGISYIKEYAKDAEKLQEFGLTPDDVVLIKDQNGEYKVAVMDEHFTGNEEQRARKAAKIQAALYAWVDSTILRPNAALRPTWMSDPRFMLIAHLKSFTYSFQNVIARRAAAQADRGNYLPAMVMTAYLPLQIAVDLARGTLNGTLHHMDTSAAALIGRGIMNSGVTGVAQFGTNAYGDLTHNGIFGQSFLGPTFDNAGTILGAMFGDGTAKEALVRSVPGGAVLRGWM